MLKIQILCTREFYSSFSIPKTTFFPRVTNSVFSKIYVFLCLFLVKIQIKLHCEFKLLSLQLEKQGTA